MRAKAPKDAARRADNQKRALANVRARRSG